MEKIMNSKIITYNKMVNYWETDKMGIVHHSNYVKWFEEARCHFLRECGIPYNEVEKSGILLPVYELSIKYLKPAFFEQNISIDVSIKELTPVKLTLCYIVRRDNETLAKGHTIHPFTDENLKPVRNSKVFLLLEKVLYSN
jgi:acyl-CoA thioester hydrolase